MSITVALVDDQILIRRGFKDMLESFGEIKVWMEADNAKAFLERLEKTGTGPDICVISSPSQMHRDIVDMSDIHKRLPALKILVIPAHLHELTAIRGLYGHIHGGFLKTAKPEEFNRAVRALRRKGAYWTKSLLAIEAEDEIATAHGSLRKQHLDFLELCLEDITYVEMSKRTGIPIRTIESYRDTLFARFNVSSRSGLVIFAIKNRIVELK